MSDFKAFHLIDAYRLCKDDIAVLIVSNNLSSVFQQKTGHEGEYSERYDIYIYITINTCVYNDL